MKHSNLHISIFRLLFLLSLTLPLHVSANKLDSIQKLVESQSSVEKKVQMYYMQAEKFLKFDELLSLDLAHLALQHEMQARNPLTRTKLHIITGQIHANLAQYWLANESFSNAEKICKKYGYQTEHLEIYFLRVFMYLNAEKKAELKKEVMSYKKYFSSLRIPKSSQYYLLESALNITEMRLLEADNSLRKSLSVNKNEFKLRIRALYNLGNSKWVQNQLDSAVYYYNKAYSIAKANKQTYDQFLICLNLAGAYEIDNQEEQALKLANRVYKIATNINWQFGKALAAKAKSEIYEKLSNYKEAYSNYNEHNILITKILNEVHAKVSTEADQRYRLEKEKNFSIKKDLTQLTEKNKQLGSQSNLKMYVALALSLVILIVLAVIFAYLKNKQRKERVTWIENNLKKNTEQLKTNGQQLKEISTIVDQVSNVVEIFSDDNPNLPFSQKISEKIENLKSKLKQDNEWISFQDEFFRKFPGFGARLFNKHPNISYNEIQIAMYLKSGMTINQIAQKKNTSPDTVRTAIRRLEKKIENPSIDDLTKYLEMI